MRYTDDDMDELFRRAAENYPLNTNSADWDKIAEKLYPAENIINSKKRRFNSHLLWIILLIPLSFIYYQLDLSNRKAAQQNVVNNEKKNQSTTQINDNRSGTITLQIINKSHQNRDIDTKSIGNEEYEIIRNSNSNIQYKFFNYNKNIQKDNNRESSNSALKQDLDFSVSNNQSSINLGQFSKNPQQLSDISMLLIYNSEINISPIEPGPLEQKIVKKEINSKNRSREHLYTGIMAGIGYSKVKERWSSNPDVNAGILIGYAFKKRWSVEGGIYYDKKYYNSEGKYLNPAKLNIPSNTEIIDVSGNCKMLEVPISIKYNIKTGIDNWFVTSGISSYFMKNENYDYTALYTSTGQFMKHHKTYNNSTNNWLSVFQISAGYSKKLGNLGNLRIEPYIKFPIQGLGIGQLPLLSTGLQVGLTRTVF